jgi:hypothetical protein
MTRHDYVLISDAINLAHSDDEYPDMDYGITKAARCIALALAADNPRFDTDRFMEACVR